MKKVSVIVPVFNPGEHIEPCIESLLAQSMPAERLELIFVDDGSTDGTGARLDSVARHADHVRVIHQRASGGPGGPRNRGLEIATGEFVYFLDDDDYLGPEALERLYEMAVRNGSDVVLGRMVGKGGRGVPKKIFEHSRDRADILKHHLLGLLTPHKLFRRSLIENLRFPEGPVRLEDHRFVLPAYLKARVISVLADYPCCYWVKRDNGENYSFRRWDPAHYYSAVREILDIIDEHVPSGTERHRFYSRWYSGKMLKRLGGGKMLCYPDDMRREIYDEVRRIVVERIPESVDKHLSPQLRVRSALVRADSYPDLLRLAEAERGMTVETSVDEVSRGDGTLDVRLSAALRYADGSPVQVTEGRSPLMELPVPIDARIPESALDVSASLPRSQVVLLVRHRRTGMEVPVPVEQERLPGGEIAFTGQASLDAATARMGEPLDAGRWDFTVRIEANGCNAESRLGPEFPTRMKGVKTRDKRVLKPFWTARGRLSCRINP